MPHSIRRRLAGGLGLLILTAGCLSPTAVSVRQAGAPLPRPLPPINTNRVERALVAAETETLGSEAEREFARAREAYWNRQTDEAIAIWRQLLVRTNHPAFPKKVLPWLMVQAYEEDGRWREALETGIEFALDRSHPRRLEMARALQEVRPARFEFNPAESEAGFNLRREHLVVADGRLNGHVARIFLDTGFSRTFVAANFARKIGLEPLPATVSLIDSNEKDRKAQVAVAASLTLAGLAASNLPVVVGDVGNLRRFVGDADVVLGWDVLQQADLRWNFPARALRISRPTGERSDSPNLSGRQAPLLRMISPDGRPLDLFLDSGYASRPPTVVLNSNAGLLNSQVARDRFRRRPWRPSFASGLYSFAIRWPRVARDFPLWFHGWEFGVPRAVVRSSVDVREGLQACDGIIGNAPFLQGTLRLNGPARTATFEPGTGAEHTTIPGNGALLDRTNQLPVAIQSADLRWMQTDNLREFDGKPPAPRARIESE